MNFRDSVTFPGYLAADMTGALCRSPLGDGLRLSQSEY